MREIGIAIAMASALALSTAAALTPAGLAKPAVRGPRASHPTRIISTTLETDELLLSLVEPERILALTPYADDPAVSNVIEKARRVQRRVRTESEVILSLRPDLVWLAPFAAPEASSLLEQATAVERVPFARTLEDVRARILHVGTVMNETEQADALVREMEQRFATVRARTRGKLKPRVLLYTRGGYVAGPGTLIDEVLQAAGGENALARIGVTGHMVLSAEDAARVNPDVIVVNTFVADERSRTLGQSADLRHEAVWKDSKAVRAHRVEEIAPRYLLTTTHFLGSTVEVLARIVHPELSW